MRLPRWLRRKRKPSFEPIRTPFTDPVPFGDEVVRHLYAVMGSLPAAERRGSRWVMNPEWFGEVRKAADPAARSAFGPPYYAIGSVELLLGIPVEVRDDGGVPHLEPYPSARPHP